MNMKSEIMKRLTVLSLTLIILFSILVPAQAYEDVSERHPQAGAGSNPQFHFQLLGIQRLHRDNEQFAHQGRLL